MRTNALLFVFLAVSLMDPSDIRPRRAGEEVRIFSSLAEAVPDPARPLLVVFFSLECPVCWEELFEMKYFIEENSVPIELVGISKDREEDLKPFLAKYSFFYPVVSDRRQELYRRFKVRLEPFKVILEQDRVLYKDNTGEDFFIRREKAKACLLEIACK